LFTWASIAAAAVALGVAGEFVVGVKIATLNQQLRTDGEQLRSASDQLLALATQEAGGAKTSAERASLAASSAGDSAKEVGRQAHELQNEVIEANKRIEQLRKDNNEAEAKLEAEKVKRLELAASLLPRDFRDQSGAIAKLSGFPPVLVFFEYLDEREVTSIGEQINFVAVGLHWKSSRFRKHGRPPEDGIKISAGTGSLPRLLSDPTGIEQQKQLDTTVGLCRVLAKVLQDSGLDAEFAYPSSNVPIGTILISIGPKPNHAVEEAIRELGKPPGPTPLNGFKAAGNRISISEASDPSKKP